MIIRSKHDLKQHLRRLELSPTRYDAFFSDHVYHVFAYSNDAWCSLCSEFKPITFYSTVPISTWLDWCSKDREIDKVWKFLRFRSSTNFAAVVTLVEVSVTTAHQAVAYSFAIECAAALKPLQLPPDLSVLHVPVRHDFTLKKFRIADAGAEVNLVQTTAFEAAYTQSQNSLIEDAVFWHSVGIPCVITVKIHDYTEEYDYLNPKFTYSYTVWDLTTPEWDLLTKAATEYRAALDNDLPVEEFLQVFDLFKHKTIVLSNHARANCQHITAAGQRNLDIPLALFLGITTQQALAIAPSGQLQLDAFSLVKPTEMAIRGQQLRRLQLMVALKRREKQAEEAEAAAEAAEAAAAAEVAQLPSSSLARAKADLEQFERRAISAKKKLGAAARSEPYAPLPDAKLKLDVKLERKMIKRSATPPSESRSGSLGDTVLKLARKGK